MNNCLALYFQLPKHHMDVTNFYRMSRTFFLSMVIAALPLAVLSLQASAQTALETGTVAPMGPWLEFRETNFNNKPILIHLRTGYERAIIMPEEVEQRNQQIPLSGTEIVVDGNIIAFYPTESFELRSVYFIGMETETVYELRVRSSTEGIRQPLQIKR